MAQTKYGAFQEDIDEDAEDYETTKEACVNGTCEIRRNPTKEEKKQNEYAKLHRLRKR